MDKGNVGKTEMAKLPKIVAVDFDGTLVVDKFPEIGYDISQRFEVCKQLRNLGVKLILWTSRDNSGPERLLDKAVEYCRSKGLEFDAVNENVKEVQELFHSDTRKVYANVYWDDKASNAETGVGYWAHLVGLRYVSGKGLFNASKKGVI